MAKKIKHIFFLLVLIFLGFAVYVVVSTPFFAINNLPKTINANYEVLQELDKDKTFGKFVKLQYDETIKTSTNNKKIRLDIKLFNLITLKTVEINTDDVELYVGGDIVGFSLNSDGVVILGTGLVETKKGKVNTTENSNIKKGDIIKEIENEQVKS
ncbi:MAG: hypothetical protein J6T39_02400, partial [Clostridia bacterium]|nr:hypothetical protein [Clostridia bacterium]